MIRSLLITSAVLEGATGAALLTVPALVAPLLLGPALDPAGLVVARVAGAALLALGLACWNARNAGRGMITPLQVYNAAAAAMLLQAHFSTGLTGIGLLPAGILHAGLAGWCTFARRSSS